MLNLTASLSDKGFNSYHFTLLNVVIISYDGVLACFQPYRKGLLSLHCQCLLVLSSPVCKMWIFHPPTITTIVVRVKKGVSLRKTFCGFERVGVFPPRCRALCHRGEHFAPEATEITQKGQCPPRLYGKTLAPGVKCPIVWGKTPTHSKPENVGGFSSEKHTP